MVENEYIQEEGMRALEILMILLGILISLLILGYIILRIYFFLF